MTSSIRSRTAETAPQVSGPLLCRLLDDVRARHARSVDGVEEAIAVHTRRFDQVAEMFLGWAGAARGEDALPAMLDAFVAFSHEVNRAQAIYERVGHYENNSYEACYKTCYGSDSFMEDYLWGIYLTNFLWAHHFEICLFYKDRFIDRCGGAGSIVEFAPGHGGWGVWALRELPAARLQGYDISSQSIRIAARLANAAGVGERTVYSEGSALDRGNVPGQSADVCICCFLVEHLETPNELFDSIRHALKPAGRAFITGALTAAQVDHIFEFRHESELIALCEQSGLRVIESLSANPRRLLPGARFVPRSMAMIAEPVN